MGEGAPEEHESPDRQEEALRDLEAFLGEPGEDDRNEREQSDENDLLDREAAPGAGSWLHAWRRVRHPIAGGRRGVSE